MKERPLVVIGLSSEGIERVGEAVRPVCHIKAASEDFTEAVALCMGDDDPIALIGITPKNPTAVFQTIPELKARDVPVVVLGPNKDADTILRALRAGASEFVVAGDDEDLLRAVTRLSRPKSDAGAGKITSVFPAKGGVGATALATNLAGALQAQRSSTCLVDLDLHFGDVLSFLDISSAYAISDLISNMRRLDNELLESSLTRHPSGVSVLAQSHRIEDAESISVDAVEKMLAFLRQHFDSIIVDGIRGFSETALTALDVSDYVLLVCTQDVPAVRNARRCLDIFNQLGYPTEKVQVILNRYTKRSTVDLDVVEDTVGVPVTATVANDFPSLIQSINLGVMLSDVSPRSKLTRDIRALSSLATGGSMAPRRRGLLGGLFSDKVALDGAQ